MRTIVLPKLLQYQQEVWNWLAGKKGSGDVAVIVACRQIGKSMFCLLKLIEVSLTRNNVVSAIFEPSLNNSRNMFKEMTKMLEGSDVIKYANAQLLEIEFVNGSRVLFKSTEQKNRGFTVSGILVLDECAYLIDEDIYTILPLTQAHNAEMIVVSTPFLKQGYFYQMYLLGQSGEDEHIKLFDWTTSPEIGTLLTEAKKDFYRKTMSRNMYHTEVEGKFLDGEGMVFTNILSNVAEPQEYQMLYAGIDWGSGKENDYTCITLFNEFAEMVYIEYFNDLGTFQQVERICGVLLRFSSKIVKIKSENNSIGNPLNDLLEKELTNKGYGKLINKIERFTTTNAEKVRLVNIVQCGLELNNIKLLNDSRLLNELAAYTATYNSKTNNVSYNAPLGLHDDTVISTMLAYDAYKSSNDYAQKNIGFLHNRRISRNKRLKK